MKPAHDLLKTFAVVFPPAVFLAWVMLISI